MNLSKWDNKKYKEYIEYLKSISEESYKKFNSKIIFTNYEILGIRLPKLRRFAKEIFKTDYKEFLNQNITYYEEAMLYLLVIALIKDIDELMLYFPKALDLIDNWALCDSFCGSLKIVINNKEYFLKVIDKLLKSDKTYNIRVGLVLLLNYYVSEEYLDLIFKYLDSIDSDEYYINMAEAWLLCEIFIKYQSYGLKYLENNKLNSFTINKTINKIRDSYRVSKDVKDKILIYKK
jgi:3-methyladenine DNA glycosylase AlkD